MTSRGLHVAPTPPPGQEGRSSRSARKPHDPDGTHLRRRPLDGLARRLDQLGIVDKRMLGNPVSRLAPTGQVSTQGQAQAQKAPAAPDSSDSIMASRQRDHSGQAGGGGGSSGPGDATAATNASAAQQSYDWLAFNTSSESGSTGTGFSTPWQPAKGPGGGAAAAARRVGWWSAWFQAGGPRRRSRRSPCPSPYPLPTSAAIPPRHHTCRRMPGRAPATKRPREVSRALLLQPAVLVRARRQDQRQPHPLPASAFRRRSLVRRLVANADRPDDYSRKSLVAPIHAPDQYRRTAPATKPPAFPLYTLDYIQGTVLLPNALQLATPGSNVDLRRRRRAPPASPIPGTPPT